MPLSRLLVYSMLSAKRAVLLELQPFPVVNLVLVGVVIAPLALRAGKRDVGSFVRRHRLFLCLSNIKDGRAVPSKPNKKDNRNWGRAARPRAKRRTPHREQPADPIRPDSEQLLYTDHHLVISEFFGLKGFYYLIGD